MLPARQTVRGRAPRTPREGPPRPLLSRAPPSLRFSPVSLGVPDGEFGSRLETLGEDCSPDPGVLWEPVDDVSLLWTNCQPSELVSSSSPSFFPVLCGHRALDFDVWP